jgi:cellulose synthase/poly-beta-1,6-N-acetylglucosamine synthase-like glycosyltransferase
MLEILAILVAILSVVLFAQALFSLYLMLYSWEHPERLAQSGSPKEYLPPQLSFTVLLPARHEENVIYATMSRIWRANYPTQLLEMVVICHADDSGTIAEARRAINDLGADNIRVETFNDGPINKPHGLNVGLSRSHNHVVTVFDAEDDIDPNIFMMVNTVMQQENRGIVQAGVQLINFRDYWFAIHNVLEYFFWFKSRLHFHARAGMIPLGGNTVFVRRNLLQKAGGWDDRCLTEDADLGLRLSAYGESIRVVYDAQHVTREETPHGIGEFIRQRTRWNQGFLQILRKGTWRGLPTLKQRLLALYTFSYPVFQAIITLLYPVMLAMVIWLKLPLAVAMLSFLPLYTLLLQLLVSMIGAAMFKREYGFRHSLLIQANLVLTFLPYQLLLGVSAVRAMFRELRNENNWEKTHHTGAHRTVDVEAVEVQSKEKERVNVKPTS